MFGQIEFTHLLAVMQLITTAVLAVVGALIKRSVGDIDRRITHNEGRTDRLEENTVGKEEWLRESSISRQRQEKILDKLSSLEGKNQAGVEIGAAIAAALNRAEKERRNG
jgi:hypothetical protein